MNAFRSIAARVGAVLCASALAAFASRAYADQTSLPALVRDPFVSSGAPAQAGRARLGDGMGPLPTLVLPPNAAAGTPPFDSSRPPLNGRVLRAMVLGARSRALLTNGDRSTIVGVGDRVGGATVTRISPLGVRLSDGTLLELDGSRT
jgi:hypothetical protein